MSYRVLMQLPALACCGSASCVYPSPGNRQSCPISCVVVVSAGRPARPEEPLIQLVYMDFEGFSADD